MYHHRQCEDTERAKYKQDEKTLTHPYFFIKIMKTHHFKMWHLGLQWVFLFRFVFFTLWVAMLIVVPCCSNNTYCICWGNDYMGPDSPRETCLALGSCCWGLARSCLWRWALFSASLGSCSMAQLDSHYIKTPGSSVALWLAHSPIAEWKREVSSPLHRLHFISI